MPGILDEEFKLSEEKLSYFSFLFPQWNMPHDIWQLRQEWEAQPGTGNLLQTGLYIAEKTKKQSLAMDEESCLSLQQECSWRARSTQVSSCLPLPFKVPERTNKPKLAALPMGGEACPGSQWVWSGRSFPSAAALTKQLRIAHRAVTSRGTRGLWACFQRGWVARTEKYCSGGTHLDTMLEEHTLGLHMIQVMAQEGHLGIDVVQFEPSEDNLLNKIL